jgi:formate/nitrite transporter
MTSFGAWSYVQSCYKMCDTGLSRTTAHWSEYLVRAPPSGVFLSFAFLLGCVGQSDSSQRVMYGAGFSLGLLFVVLTNSFLWTADVMYISIAWLAGEIKLGGMLRPWLFVYIGNAIGALGSAYLVGPGTGVVEPGTRYADMVVQVALNKASLEPIHMFVRGLVGNWLVCLADLFAVMNKSFSGKFLGIFLANMMFATIGYDHGVADWGVLTMAKMIEPTAFGWDRWALVVVLTTVGNIVGGVVFMGFPAALTIYLDKIYYNRVTKDDKRPGAIPLVPLMPAQEDEKECEDEEEPFQRKLVTPPRSVDHLSSISRAQLSVAGTAPDPEKPSG